MKTIEIACFCIKNAILHPRTPIANCMGNPVPIQKQSPIPWYGSIGVLIIGIISWILSAKYGIVGLDEAARAMVYIPLGNIFGMSLTISKT